MTVSLPSDLVQRLDRRRRAERGSRSGIVESWLRAGERQSALSSLERELEIYYSDRKEDRELGVVLGKAARKVARESPRRRGKSSR